MVAVATASQGLLTPVSSGAMSPGWATDDGDEMLSRIKKLTDMGAMTRLLHETVARERDIDVELDGLLGQRQELEKKLLAMVKSAEVLELVRADAEQMHRSVRGTCALAEHVSGKVRELDVAQSRVHGCIVQIEAIVDRTNCIEGVKKALEKEDYEAATKYVATFLQLDVENGRRGAEAREGEGEGEKTKKEKKKKKKKMKRVQKKNDRSGDGDREEGEEEEDGDEEDEDGLGGAGEDDLAGGGGRSGAGALAADFGGESGLSEQRAQLLQSKKTLEDVIRRRFAQAAEAPDHDEAVRFARLFGPLGLEEEGGRAFTSYLRGVVSARALEEFDKLTRVLEAAAPPLIPALAPASAPPTDAFPGDFVGALTELLKDIAVAIEENEQVMRDAFGEESLANAVKELQAECDVRGGQLLKLYVSSRRLTWLVKEVNERKARAGGGGGVVAVAGNADDSRPDPREIELHLEDMLMIAQRSEEYAQFMTAKLREAEAASASAQMSPRAANLLRRSGFNRAVQEVIGYYIVLEEYFMVENVAKAIQIDEAMAESLTTSMVDDVFYILQNCARRAICTGNVQCALAVVNNVSNLLGNEYKEALQRKLREPNLAAKLFAAATAAGGVGGGVGAGGGPGGGVAGAGMARGGADIATALNNADVSTEYVLKLRHELEELAAEIFTATADREKLKSCFGELSETSNIFRKVAMAGLDQLTNTITPRVRVVLDGVAAVDYELTEAQYAENEVNDPWVQLLLHTVETNALWLQSLLTTNNYDLLILSIVDFIVKRLEALMAQKRFNQLGGLQLDRDARMLVSHFSTMTQRTVRDKFARLTQMATLLNLEKVSEILDYWGENSGPMTWRLTPAEVRRVLLLRVDFKREVVESLKL